MTTLAGVRQEDPAVFSATHRRVATMIEEGVAGLRVDHPDGLVDPGEYQERLRPPRTRGLDHRGEDPGTGRAAAATGRSPAPPATTRCGRSTGSSSTPPAEAEATERYQRLTGDQLTSAEQVERGKRMIVDTAARRRGRPDRRARARGRRMRPRRVAEVAVAFAVYRSYLPDGVADLDKALVLAEQRRPELASAFAALVATPARRRRTSSPGGSSS